MNVPSGRSILMAASALIAGSVMAGVVLIGSPGSGRVQQLDAGRVADLQGIMRATDLYFARNDRLPVSLEELDQDPRAAVNTIDPGSGAVYEYRASGRDSYQLCADFDGESVEPPARSGTEFWRHGAGRVCFDLVVDPTAGNRP